MTTYNRLPSASHFLPYFAGPKNELHFSYTDSHMFCKREVLVGDERFVYVETVALDEDSLDELNAMATNDFVGPASVLEGLRTHTRADEKLEDAFHSLRQYATERESLSEKFCALEVDSKEAADLAAQLEMLSEDERESRREIERHLAAFNQESGYDIKKGYISASGV